MTDVQQRKLVVNMTSFTTYILEGTPSRVDTTIGVTVQVPHEGPRRYFLAAAAFCHILPRSGTCFAATYSGIRISILLRGKEMLVNH